MIIYYFINIIYNMDFFANLANKAKEKVSEAGKNVADATLAQREAQNVG